MSVSCHVGRRESVAADSECARPSGFVGGQAVSLTFKIYCRPDPQTTGGWRQNYLEARTERRSRSTFDGGVSRFASSAFRADFQIGSWSSTADQI